MTSRIVVIVALSGVAALAALLVAGRGGDGHVVRAAFVDAGGLREGSKVQVDGVPVGTVERIELTRGDRALVEARTEDGAGPIGSDARATVRAANLLGEKYLDLERGSSRAPAAAVIPPSRTGVAVELDDVINALDLPTRAALRVVIGESGTALTGRGTDLAATLDALPDALHSTGELLAQVSTDNRALGRLVEESDRVVGAVAGERRALGRLVGGAATTLQTVASRRKQLGDTVRHAPATLAATRRALAALDAAAAPLGPAARGLRATAPQLTAVLDQLPPFLRAARPTLHTARAVAPTLERLGREGTPLVRRVRPLAGQLRTFATEMAPVTTTLDDGIPDLLGVLEGWARATAAKDGAGHVFRAGLTVGSDLFAMLLERPSERTGRRRRQPAEAESPPAPSAPRLPAPRLPDVDPSRLKLPKLPRPELPRVPKVDVPHAAEPLLDFLLEP